MKFCPAGFADAEAFLDCNEPETYRLDDLLSRVRDLEGHDESLKFPIICDEDLLVWSLSLLCESPLGRAFAHDARFEDWAIELDDCDDGQFIADAQMRILILPRCALSLPALARSPYMRSMFLAEFCRGLRGIWHSGSGVPLPGSLTVFDQIRWTRAVEADYDLLMLAVAWELREAGHPELWRYLIGSDLGDLAVAWVAMLERNPQGLSQPALLKRMFFEWLGDETNRNEADHIMLTRLDQALHNLGYGKGYGERELTAEDFQALTTLPEGISYLAGGARALLDDPTQITMTDPINAAHLQQIESDLAQMRMTRASFRDRELALKFFPDLERNGIDTLV